jgi:hypothetical protein
MCSRTLHLRAQDYERADFAALALIEPQLVIAFFSQAAMDHPRALRALQAACHATQLVGCSTAGEIGPRGLTEQGLVVLALRFAAPRLRVTTTDIDGDADSRAAGERLALALDAPDLCAVLVLAPGDNIDGDALTAGLAQRLAPRVHLFGGLAGDGSTLAEGPAAGLGGRFQTDPSAATWTLRGNRLHTRQAVAVGWYGDAARVAHGMCSGAQPFGPVRRVTRAEGAVLFELDGEPALDIYRRYLGDYALQLPAAGLMFPFELLDEHLQGQGVVRTLVDIDEPRRALVLAGSVTPGMHLRLMHASTDNLTRGAAAAAADGALHLDADGDGGIALLVSCMDRKLVMGERVADEIDAVAGTLAPTVPLVGFYANGEIGRPALRAQPCLNNQTMAVTCLWQ